MPEIIISDTSCLILFDEIGTLDLLQKTYGEITTTPEVIEEYTTKIPHWINVVKVKNKSKQKEFEQLVDKGEASAIALALEIENCMLIIDDKKGRKLAIEKKIKVTGTLGTLLKAKHKGIITAIKPFVDKLVMIKYRVAKEIIEGILKEAGE